MTNLLEVQIEDEEIKVPTLKPAVLGPCKGLSYVTHEKMIYYDSTHLTQKKVYKYIVITVACTYMLITSLESSVDLAKYLMKVTVPIKYTIPGRYAVSHNTCYDVTWTVVFGKSDIVISKQLIF